jgi:hypothetical protein
MDWGGPGFVIAIIALVTFGKIINNYIRVRHGYEPEENGRRGSRRRGMSGDDALRDDRKVALLTSENERLNGQVGRLEERIAVLERIATDPAERTAREIEALRDR